ncbi:MAG TPA: DUF3500 domain-containing protein [Planctomycetaceae bacterium]|nr:DUF3500 domain-containing protein [Planctomycetaceae bacterium]
MGTRKLSLAALVLSAMAVLLSANLQTTTPSGIAMTKAAKEYLGTLTNDQRKQTSFAFDDKERLNWHFIPRPRNGLPVKQLEGDAFKSAFALILAGLSEAGYDQALNVMSLEEVLYLLEGGARDERRAKRDPQKYYVSIFGTPAETGTWGWRLEGHHVSLNYTIKDGKVVSSTPEFFGANPGTIDAGLGRQIRVLGPEEDIARAILKLCDSEQQKLAWIDKSAPDDLRTGGATGTNPVASQPETATPVGLPASKMSSDQKKLLADLLSEYLKNMPADVEKERRAAIEQAGLDKIYFAWWGDADQHKRHYYRVQGPTFLIEYNNTQNNANHVHSMWRNLGGDFNIPIAK